MTKHHVSVIIPVYNRAEYLRHAVESVLNQTHPYYEVIIVDDASTDNTAETAASFDDERIRVIQNDQNRGVSYSRNRGIFESRYRLIALLDSDDAWLPNKLEFQTAFLDKHSTLNVVHTEEIWIRNGVRVNQKKHHRKSGGDIFVRSLELCLMSPSSIMLKKNIFDRYGFFDEELIVCEDYDMWLRITAAEEVGFIETPLIQKYGGHSDQLSRAYPAMDRYRVKSLLKIMQNVSLTDEQLAALKKTAVNKLSILINGAKKRGRSDDVKEYEEMLGYFTP